MQRAGVSLHATTRQHVVLPCGHAQLHSQHRTSHSAKLIKTPSSLIIKVETNLAGFSPERGGDRENRLHSFSILLPRWPWKYHIFFESPLDVVAEARHGEGKGAGPWAPQGAWRWIL